MSKPVTTERLLEASRFLLALNDLAATSGYHLDAHMEMYVDENDHGDDGLQYLFAVRWNGDEYVTEEHVR